MTKKGFEVGDKVLVRKAFRLRGKDKNGKALFEDVEGTVIEKNDRFEYLVRFEGGHEFWHSEPCLSLVP